MLLTEFCKVNHWFKVPIHAKQAAIDQMNHNAHTITVKISSKLNNMMSFFSLIAFVAKYNCFELVHVMYNGEVLIYIHETVLSFIILLMHHRGIIQNKCAMFKSFLYTTNRTDVCQALSLLYGCKYNI